MVRSAEPSPRHSILTPAKVEAKFDKGVLHIHLPKPAEVATKQQKIEIKKAKADRRKPSDPGSV
jgi:hypothetical protein